MENYDADLLIIGAGPVGMCAAIEAAGRGKKVIILEQRPENDPAGAKCNSVAARTMELFRRFGVADQIRNAGLPDDFPTDATYLTSITGIELTRLKMPSRNERSQPGFPDSDWRTPEPIVRVSQIYIEPILAKKLNETNGIDVRYCAKFSSYKQDENGVTVTFDKSGKTAETLRGKYLIGADGASSMVRKTMGARLSGDVEIARSRSSLIKAPRLKALFKDRPVWMSWVVNHNVRGVVVAINGTDTWLVHRALAAGETDYETVDMHQSIRDVLGVDETFEYEVLNHEDWVGRRMISDRMRDNRVFIAGDAAHLWVPFAGYGMNAGIADGVHAAWIICNVLDGWAGSAMLDAYEAERHPITEQVSRYAMQNMVDTMDALGENAVPSAFSSKYNPAGAAMRAVMTRRLAPINAAQFAPEGLNFGYFYDASPIIETDGTSPPPYTMDQITPSTVPGCRLPHFWDGEGRSIYDRLGPVYTMLRFDTSIDVNPFLAACDQVNLPMALIDAEKRRDDSAYSHDLLIVRQDQHVAWRGHDTPKDIKRLIARLSGKPEVAQ